MIGRPNTAPGGAPISSSSSSARRPGTCVARARAEEHRLREQEIVAAKVVQLATDKELLRGKSKKGLGFLKPEPALSWVADGRKVTAEYCASGCNSGYYGGTGGSMEGSMR